MVVPEASLPSSRLPFSWPPFSSAVAPCCCPWPCAWACCSCERNSGVWWRLRMLSRPSVSSVQGNCLVDHLMSFFAFALTPSAAVSRMFLLFMVVTFLTRAPQALHSPAAPFAKPHAEHTHSMQRLVRFMGLRMSARLFSNVSFSPLCVPVHTAWFFRRADRVPRFLYSLSPHAPNRA